MSARDNGGTAFPSTSWTNEGDFRGANDGMTLRDYFAAKAMQGLIAQSCGTAGGSRVELGAQFAYEMADAMLAERSK